MAEFPRARSTVERIVDRSATSGATLQVRQGGEVALDLAVGSTVTGEPLSTADRVPWFSASKLPATLAVARAWEQGLLAPTDPVADHIPEFAGAGKERIRIGHLLAHTAPLRGVDRTVGGLLPEGRDALLERILAAAPDPGWEPGERAGYLGHVGYLLLDEIVARRSGIGFAEFQRRHVLHPLGLRSDLGRSAGEPVLDVPWLGDPRLAARVAGHDVGLGYPSACMAGPFADAARLCEVLRRGGVVGDTRILAPGTCAALLADHRPLDAVDEAAGRPRRWGWGVALDQTNWAPASPRSFGVLGGTACLAFSDPDSETTVALHFLGNVSPDERVGRDRDVTRAIRADLASTGAAGG